jgi:hypothetical protein
LQGGVRNVDDLDTASRGKEKFVLFASKVRSVCVRGVTRVGLVISMSPHEQQQVATLPRRTSHDGDEQGSPVVVGGGDGANADDEQLQLHGSLWHLLRAKTLAVSTTTTAAATATTTDTPPTSPHAAAVVEVSRSSAWSSTTEEEGGVTTSLSLRAVLHEASALAALLRAEGRVAAGDRVAILLRNSPLFVVAQYAVAGAGAIAVNCNTRLTAPELRAQFADAGVKVVIADDEFAHTLALALRQPPAAGDGVESSVNPDISPASVLVLWAPAAQQQQLEESSGAAATRSSASSSTPSYASSSSAAAAAVTMGMFDRQRRLELDSAAYELFYAVGDVGGVDGPSSSADRGEERGGGAGDNALRLPWAPEEEGPRELGARYFQMMYTSGTTVGGGGLT